MCMYVLYTVALGRNNEIVFRIRDANMCTVLQLMMSLIILTR